MNEIDPWASEQQIDYDKLFSEFGMSKIDSQMASRLAFRLSDRGILFAHRDLDLWLRDAEEGKEVAVMSGIKPSSEFHLGSKLTAEEIIFFQKKFRAKVFYAIADLEAYADNGMSLEETHETAVSNVADLLALGLDPKNAHIYKQSQEKRVMQMAYLFAKRATPAMLKAIYGERNYSLYFAALTQVGDILLPQHKDFGGAKRVVVPVGVDQDPHMRLARDIAFKERLILPSATYHRIMRSLRGESKMSKRDPGSTLSLPDTLPEAQKKLSAVFTGGRTTADEQKKLGGEIEKCVLFDVMRFHFVEDKKTLAKMMEGCTSGKVLCGECKKTYIKYALDWLSRHQEKKKKMLPKARKLLENTE